ncbi:MAG: endonuclease/exonuclease/phosphatase family metal-dependent hydrolase, partial [Rhodothermales bacterium]
MLLAALLVLSACAQPDPTDKPPGERADTLRILAYNIHHGAGMDEVLDLDRIAALIREVNPDLVALQEMDSVVTRTGGVDQMATLGRLTGLQPLFGRFMAYQGGAYGMGILSGWPVERHVNHRLPDGDEPRTVLAAHVKSPETGRLLRFVSIHFYRTEEERLAQAIRMEELLNAEPQTTILAGDYNSLPGDRVIQHLKQNWSFVDKGADRLTFPSFGPEREIDYFAFTPGSGLRVVNQYLIDEPVI